MNYWLLSTVPHVAEFPHWVQTNVARLSSIPIDERLKNGDIIYIYDSSHDAICGWGFVTERRETEKPNAFFVTVSGGKIQNFLSEPGRIKQNELLSPLLTSFIGATAFLLNKQIMGLEQLMIFLGPKPPLPTTRQFVLNQPVDEDEGLHTEYKETVINNIPGEAYDYVLPFIRGNGGSIFFGVRNQDKKPVGIDLTWNQRDRLLRTLEDKLSGIQPPISANTDYFLTFHPIVDDLGNALPDRFVFEIEVRGQNDPNYRSAGGKAYDKTFSGRRKVN